MPGLTVYTDKLGHQPADTTFTVTNIRFTDGAGGNGLLDGDSSGLQTIDGDPIALVADATDPDRSSPASRADPYFAVSTSSLDQGHLPLRWRQSGTIRSTLATSSGWGPSAPPALQLPGAMT